MKNTERTKKKLKSVNFCNKIYVFWIGILFCADPDSPENTLKTNLSNQYFSCCCTAFNAEHELKLFMIHFKLLAKLKQFSFVR